MKKLGYETLVELRYELRKFLNFSERAAESHDLAAQQNQALPGIEGYPGRNSVSIGELEERLRIPSHTAVRLVNRLENGGLIQREAGVNDRRTVTAKLTKEGAKLEELAAVHHRELQTVGPLLTDLLKKVSSES